MTRSRRKLLTGLGATAFVGGAAGLAHAKKIVRACPITGPYAGAADYSAERRGVSMLVMRDGKILLEDYPQPGGPEEAWELASGTKSFTGVMAAAAQADGFLDIEELASKTLPEWKYDPRKSRITIRNLLSLNSGLKGPGAIGQPPAYLEALKAEAKYDPGVKFEYGPASFQVFGEIMKRKLRAANQPDDPSVWLQRRVLDRIDVQVSDWRRGKDGNPFMPQGARLTARNWARFGQWVMDGGKGVDPHVMKALFEPSSTNPGYGLSWWLLRPGLIGPNPRAGIDGDAIGAVSKREDIVMAAGAGDQRLYLLRERRLVVVRQANEIFRSMGPLSIKFRDEDFLKLILT
jgi:CubicO group peptidase (beta-lactamase class C family)